MHEVPEGDPPALAPALRFGAFRGVLLASCVMAAAYVGWRLLWFLTDDAFIDFRYVSNAMLGRGLVWNPAPFAPVEGYTSLLWTLILWGTWKWTGIEPPLAANWLSLGCALGTLGCVVFLVGRMRLPAAYARTRWPILGLVLLGTLANRTFLAWMSSGLETALFNLLVTAWFVSALRIRSGRRMPWLVATLAALVALTRPDGLLFVASTGVLIAVHALRRDRRAWLALSPLLVVPLHLTFRYATYGELVPNTYFAKHVAAWPESGVRYLGAFVLEYAIWVWLLIALVAVGALRRAVRRGGGIVPFALDHAEFVVAIGTILIQVAYYTFVIGGDHFEFRVYSHLIALLFASASFMLAWSSANASLTLITLGFFVAMSWPIPWVHWAKTHRLNTRTATHVLVMPVADDLPWLLRPLGRAWDSLEAWLIPHHVGMRHQEHKILAFTLLKEWPPRSVGQRIPWSEHAVTADYSVGIIGWIAPNVAVIDLYGLNDRVIAHTPIPPTTERQMAHDRAPPPGYVECFKPNVRVVPGHIQGGHRVLTDEEIRSCERKYWEQVSKHAGTPGTRE